MGHTITNTISSHAEFAQQKKTLIIFITTAIKIMMIRKKSDNRLRMKYKSLLDLYSQ